jgi:hypothetical protein
MGYIPHVVMPTFKRGHIPTKYLIKDQVASEHFWGLIHQGTRPRINPCPRHGYPGPCPGALDISRDFNCLVPDQEPQSYTEGPLEGLYCLVPDQIPQECTGGLRSRLGSLPSSRRMALATALNSTWMSLSWIPHGVLEVIRRLSFGFWQKMRRNVYLW